MTCMEASQHDWSAYYDATRNGSHFRLLDEAIAAKLGDSSTALDLGAGALRNTRFLRSHGYEVDALDASPMFMEEAARINDSGVHAYNQTFDEFSYPENRYGIIVAASALTFNPPQTFWSVLQRIKASLAPGGVLCANFSGKRDEWAGDSEKSFVTREELLVAFADIDIVICEEWERDTPMAVGGMKHSHIIELIARRPV